MKKIMYVLTILLAVHCYTTYCAEEHSGYVELFQNQLIRTLHDFNTLEEKIDFLNDRINAYTQFLQYPGNEIFAEYRKIALDLKKKLLETKRNY